MVARRSHCSRRCRAIKNAVTRVNLYRMWIARAETVIKRRWRHLKRKIKRIAIDLDHTDDWTHNAQQVSFFNSHYDKLVVRRGAGAVVTHGRAGNTRRAFLQGHRVAAGFGVAGR